MHRLSTVLGVSDETPAIAAGITKLDDVNPIIKLATKKLSNGDTGFVVNLGVAMWRQHGSGRNAPWQSRSVLNHTVDLLSLSPGTVEPAVRLISTVFDHRQLRHAASRLASAHTAEELTVVFDAGRSEELRACVLQEIVLRGGEVRHRWAESSHWRFHPLAWLPSKLTWVEDEPDLPRYRPGTVSGVGHGVNRESSVTGGGPVPEWVETTTAEETTAIGAAVDNWVRESNGRIEARSFLFDAALKPESVRDALVAVGLESTTGLPGRLGVTTATEVWNGLFGAASDGGAYNSGDAGAYGRLFAWQSMAGLMAVPGNPSVLDLDAEAQRCSWYTFAGDTKWFHNVMWDVGVAVVSADRRRLAVLAATDTD